MKQRTLFEEEAEQKEPKQPIKDFIEKHFLWVDNSNPQVFKKVKIHKYDFHSPKLYQLSLTTGRTVKREPIPLPNTVRTTYYCEKCGIPVDALNRGFLQHVESKHPKVVQKELKALKREKVRQNEH